MFISTLWPIIFPVKNKIDKLHTKREVAQRNCHILCEARHTWVHTKLYKKMCNNNIIRMHSSYVIILTKGNEACSEWWLFVNFVFSYGRLTWSPTNISLNYMRGSYSSENFMGRSCTHVWWLLFPLPKLPSSLCRNAKKLELEILV